MRQTTKNGVSSNHPLTSKSYYPTTLNQFLNKLLGGGRVLGNSLGTFRDGVLGELSGKDESDSGLDLSGRDG